MLRSWRTASTLTTRAIMRTPMHNCSASQPRMPTVMRPPRTATAWRRRGACAVQRVVSRGARGRARRGRQRAQRNVLALTGRCAARPGAMTRTVCRRSAAARARVSSWSRASALRAPMIGTATLTDRPTASPLRKVSLHGPARVLLELRVAAGGARALVEGDEPAMRSRAPLPAPPQREPCGAHQFPGRPRRGHALAQ